MSPSDHQPDDFAALWVSTQPRVTAYIASVVNNFHETEDVLQKVATIAFEKRDQFDRAHSFAAWVNGIARFELMRWRRDKARDRHVFSEEMISMLGSLNVLISDEFEDRRAALQHCFNKLDHECKELVEFRYLDDLNPAAIADRVQIKPATVRVRLYRIRQALADCIQRQINKQGGRHA